MLQTWVIAGGVLGTVESVTVSEKLCGEPGWERGKKEGLCTQDTFSSVDKFLL